MGMKYDMLQRAWRSRRKQGNKKQDNPTSPRSPNREVDTDHYESGASSGTRHIGHVRLLTNQPLKHLSCNLHVNEDTNAISLASLPHTMRWDDKKQLTHADKSRLVLPTLLP
jgi:hypothetical protein